MLGSYFLVVVELMIVTAGIELLADTDTGVLVESFTLSSVTFGALVVVGSI